MPFIFTGRLVVSLVSLLLSMGLGIDWLHLVLDAVLPLGVDVKVDVASPAT